MLLSVAIHTGNFLSFRVRWAVPAYWILAGISSGISGTLQAVIVAEYVPAHRLGATRGILASMMILASAAGPAVYGWLLAADVPTSAVLWGTALAMIGATVLGTAARGARASPLARDV